MSLEQLSLPLDASESGAPDIFASADFEIVADWLKQGALLLTANGAQAVDWKRRVLLATDANICPTPLIRAWPEWLRELCEDDLALPLALNRLQEIQLWEQVIRDDLSEGSQSASSISGLARHASQAWSIMCEYNVELSELQGSGEEAEALRRWVMALKLLMSRADTDQSALAGRGLASDLYRQLPERISNLCGDVSERVLPATILLAGFERLTPLQQQLLMALHSRGISVFLVKEAEKFDVAARVVSCADADAEPAWLGERIQALLAAQPGARIAVLISDSIRDSSALANSLNARLLPEKQLNPFDGRQAVMMPPEPLSDAPMIRQLFFVLGLAGRHQLGFADCSRLLFSPWLAGYEEEQGGRVGLDLWLRRNNRHQISMAALLASERMQGLPRFASIIAVLSQWKAGRKKASEWVVEVNRLLQSCGLIPSGFEDETRSNEVVRLINNFRDVLASLIALDAIGSSLSWSRFLSVLRTACTQASADQEVCWPNVVVMPLAQAAGLQFEHVLVIGFDEQASPQPARPLPLLPLPMQQKYSMERSNAALAYAHSQYIWQQLIQMADNIEISFARQRGEEECRLSPFAHGLPQQDAIISLADQAIAIAAEPYVEAVNLPLFPDEMPAGGTAIIRDQSACAFRAFARHRLGITELGDSVPGIEATTKGSLLHLALEHIWRQLGGSMQLAGLSEADEALLIDAAIEHAWQACRSSVPAQISEIESQRMRRLLSEWLALERTRPAFQVLALEQGWQLMLPEQGEQRFCVFIKADRIDRDAEGRRLLIDYKSGQKQSVAKWTGARMAEPQLPLYALAAGLGDSDAVSFARLRSGEMGFEGLSGEEIGIEGIYACDGKRGRPDDWCEVLSQWKETINVLAAEFAGGQNSVSPRDAMACRYCGLEAVCRVDELGIDFGDDNESEDNGASV